MGTILCVDDDPAVLTTFRKTLERAGHDAVLVKNGEAALKVLERGGVDLILSDYRMPGISGLELLEIARGTGDPVPFIMVTGHGTIEQAVAAVKAGAHDYLQKPLEPRQLEIAVEQALEYTRLRRENEALKAEVRQLRGERSIVGESEPLKRVIELIRTVAPTRSTVLIQGESGTGKELIARAVHDWSDRGERAFVSVNCAALPETLIESSLFGHEKGAFTGATRMVKGAFERADGGTLLLDEVTEMRPDLQAKLLRVIQEQEFERVGGGKPVKVDVRIVATTNRDLKEAVRQKEFRDDLYYRLAVVPVTIPPLRDRPADIPVLAHHFARERAEADGREIRNISPEAMDLLLGYDWPGNVRELAHAMERAVLLSTETVLRPGDLDLGGQRAVSDADPAPADQGRVVLDTLDIREAEAALIERALQETEQNRTRAAELLGISVRTLRNKLNKD